MPLTVPADLLLRWNDDSAQRWRDLITAHPSILSLPCDIRDSQTVARLMQHIVAVELRYAQRLDGQAESDYSSVPYDTAEALFATHARAIEILRRLLADSSYDWSGEIIFQTISSGKLRAARRDVLIHLLMHSIRHYAQLATLVRSQGFKPDWPMDYLFLEAKPA